MAYVASAAQRDRAYPLASTYEVTTRVYDVAFSLAALIFLMPLMVVIALLVMVFGGRGPVIFAQNRIGRDGKLFRCLKFRSMIDCADDQLAALLKSCPESRMTWERDQKLRNDPRITPIGRLLRKTSLDELPQFWNVLMGDMSIVGPRPIVDGERYRYGRYFGYYTMTKPGITGLWQISGRNAVSYRRRVAMDVAFAKSRSPGMYLKILLMTVPAVLLARGSS